MGMGRNGESLKGIPWEWELVTKLGMGMGRNGNRLHGNGREWECKKPFPAISNQVVYHTTSLPKGLTLKYTTTARPMIIDLHSSILGLCYELWF